MTELEKRLAEEAKLAEEISNTENNEDTDPVDLEDKDNDADQDNDNNAGEEDNDDEDNQGEDVQEEGEGEGEGEDDDSDPELDFDEDGNLVENKDPVKKSKRTLTSKDLNKKDTDKKSFNERYADFKKKKSSYGGLTISERRSVYQNLEKEELVARLVEFDGAVPTKDRFIAKLQRENVQLQKAMLSLQNESLRQSNISNPTNNKSEQAPETQDLTDAQKAVLEKYKDIDGIDSGLLKDLMSAGGKKDTKSAEEINYLKSQLDSVIMEKNQDRTRANFNQVLNNGFPDMGQFVNTSEFSDFRNLKFSDLNLNVSDSYAMEQFQIPANKTIGEILNKSTEIARTEPILILLKHFKEVAGALGKTKKIDKQQVQPTSTSTSSTRTKPREKNVDRMMSKLAEQYNRGEITPDEFTKKNEQLERLALKLLRK